MPPGGVGFDLKAAGFWKVKLPALKISSAAKRVVVNKQISERKKILMDSEDRRGRRVSRNWLLWKSCLAQDSVVVTLGRSHEYFWGSGFAPGSWAGCLAGPGGELSDQLY